MLRRGSIERRNVVVVPGSVCTDGGEWWGEVRWYDRRRGRTRREKRERKKEGPNEGGKRRKKIERQGARKEGWWNGIVRRGRRRGWQCAGQSTGGEAKSMHRGGMQRAPIRGPTSESTFYRTLRRTVLLSASLSLLLSLAGYYICICVNVVSARHRIYLDARSCCT